VLHHRKRALVGATTRPGSTIAEIVIATGIVGVMLVATLESVGMVYRTRRINANRLTGPGLAQELLAEVACMPYEDPETPGGPIGLDPGDVTRANFDDVDDYHTWAASDARAKGGAALAGYAGWQQHVAVAYADLANPSTNAGSDLGLKRITVTVTSPEGRAATVVALRTRKGSHEQPQGLDADAVTSLGAALQLGAGVRTERWGVHLSNPADDPN